MDIFTEEDGLMLKPCVQLTTLCNFAIKLVAAFAEPADKKTFVDVFAFSTSRSEEAQELLLIDPTTFSQAQADLTFSLSRLEGLPNLIPNDARQKEKPSMAFSVLVESKAKIPLFAALLTPSSHVSDTCVLMSVRSHPPLYVM